MIWVIGKDFSGYFQIVGGLLNAIGCTEDFNWDIWKAEALESYTDNQQFQLIIEHNDNK